MVVKQTKVGVEYVETNHIMLVQFKKDFRENNVAMSGTGGPVSPSPFVLFL